MSPIHRICDALGARSVVRAGMARVSTVPSIASSMTARVTMPRAAQERPVAMWGLREVVMPTQITDQMVGNKAVMCRPGDRSVGHDAPEVDQPPGHRRVGIGWIRFEPNGSARGRCGRPSGARSEFREDLGWRGAAIPMPGSENFLILVART